jgi:hypothetical protein
MIIPTFVIVMRPYTKITLILFLFVVLLFSTCSKFEDFPIQPIIEYNNFLLEFNETTGITERGVLMISYQDGDGDIGLRPKDTFPPFHYGGDYYYNMIIDYYEKQNGKWELIPLIFPNSETGENDTLTFSVRIPNLTPLTGNQAIKGVIQDTVFIYNPLSEYDTIKFSVYIIDRALHKSNTVETPPIVRVSN